MNATTDTAPITIEVETHYIEEESYPEDERYVFAHTIVENWIVTFSKQFVDFSLEGFNFLQLFEDFSFLILRFGAFIIDKVTLTVDQRSFAVLDIV